MLKRDAAITSERDSGGSPKAGADTSHTATLELQASIQGAERNLAASETSTEAFEMTRIQSDDHVPSGTRAMTLRRSMLESRGRFPRRSAARHSSVREPSLSIGTGVPVEEGKSEKSPSETLEPCPAQPSAVQRNEDASHWQVLERERAKERDREPRREAREENGGDMPVFTCRAGRGKSAGSTSSSPPRRARGSCGHESEVPETLVSHGPSPPFQLQIIAQAGSAGCNARTTAASEPEDTLKSGTTGADQACCTSLQGNSSREDAVSLGPGATRREGSDGLCPGEGPWENSEWC